MSGGGGKAGSSKVRVVDYRLSVQYGVCVGPVDALVDILVNDKSLSTGEMAETVSVSVDKPNLFGGPTKNGGPKGRVHAFLGDGGQTLPDFLANKLGREPGAVSAFRDRLTVWFTGARENGFKWGSNYPAIPPVKFKVRRAPRGLEGDPLIGADANPAHIVYECMVNEAWGAGTPSVFIDNASFLAAAQTFREEGLGLSEKWTRADSIFSFINHILVQAGAAMSFDFATEKWAMTPLRSGYSLDSLLRLHDGVAQVASVERRGWGEVVNQIVLKWTNPKNEKTETVTVQNLAAKDSQTGAVVSDDSRDFTSVRNRALANVLAARELRNASENLLVMTHKVSVLAAENLRPGDVVYCDYALMQDDDGARVIPGHAARVMEVSRSRRGRSFVEIQTVEDVFTLGQVRPDAQEDLSVDPGQEPTDPPDVAVLNAPYYFAAQAFGDSGAAALDDSVGSVLLLVDTTLRDTRDIDVYSRREDEDGNLRWTYIQSSDEADLHDTPSAIPAEVESVITFPQTEDPGDLAFRGALVLLRGGGEEEICVATSYDSATNAVTLRRGCLDTMPRAWPAGTKLWAALKTARVGDPTEVFVGESVDYRFRPITSLGRLRLNAATTHSVLVSDRLHRPLRPANIALDAQTGFAFTIPSSATETTISWANRNREEETRRIWPWTAAEISPEFGQTTSVELVRGATVLASDVGNSGSESVLDISGATLVPGEALTLRVWAERDSYVSWTTVEIPVTVTA